jgi:hypothetical protein
VGSSKACEHDEIACGGCSFSSGRQKRMRYQLAEARANGGGFSSQACEIQHNMATPAPLGMRWEAQVPASTTRSRAGGAACREDDASACDTNSPRPGQTEGSSAVRPVIFSTTWQFQPPWACGGKFKSLRARRDRLWGVQLFVRTTEAHAIPICRGQGKWRGVQQSGL